MSLYSTEKVYVLISEVEDERIEVHIEHDSEDTVAGVVYFHKTEKAHQFAKYIVSEMTEAEVRTMLVKDQ